MFVGHGLLALAIVSAAATVRGSRPSRALVLGAVAAGFATLPDVDVLYPLLAALVAAGSIGEAPAAFWELSTTVHRGATHSLVVGTWTVLGATLWTSRDRLRSGVHSAESASAGSPGKPAAGGWAVATAALALAVLGALVLATAVTAGVLTAAMVGVMALGAIAIATIAGRADVDARTVGAAALVGLLSHPFGDLFTGQPPPFVFPFEATLIGSRVSLHADPTMHLVGAFLVELATVWLAVVVVATLLGRRPWTHVRPRALAGVGFAVAVLVLPPPSLSAATTFVAGALVVGAVGVPLHRRPSQDHWWDGLCTALVAVTLAVISYGVAYALV